MQPELGQKLTGRVRVTKNYEWVVVKLSLTKKTFT